MLEVFRRDLEGCFIFAISSFRGLPRRLGWLVQGISDLTVFSGTCRATGAPRGRGWGRGYSGVPVFQGYVLMNVLACFGIRTVWITVVVRYGREPRAWGRCWEGGGVAGEVR